MNVDFNKLTGGNAIDSKIHYKLYYPTPITWVKSQHGSVNTLPY